MMCDEISSDRYICIRLGIDNASDDGWNQICIYMRWFKDISRFV